MSTNIDELVKTIGDMTVFEMVELIKQMEQVYNVKAEAPVMYQVDQQVAQTKAEERKTSFDVWLESYGENKVGVIKAVRELLGTGLKETMDIVVQAPVLLRSGVNELDGQGMVAKITAVGGKVTLK